VSTERPQLTIHRNHPERLDPALGRAGRFDVRVPFFDATPAQAHALYEHFYPLSEFTAPATPVKLGPSARPAVNLEHGQAGLNLIDGLFSEKMQAGEVQPIESQYELDMLANRFMEAVFPTVLELPTDPPEEKAPSMQPGSDTLNNRTSVGSVAGVKGCGVSMAQLQGYLIGWKEDPRGAVEGARAWAEELARGKKEVKSRGAWEMSRKRVKSPKGAKKVKAGNGSGGGEKVAAGEGEKVAGPAMPAAVERPVIDLSCAEISKEEKKVEVQSQV
jgi:chaperone BCS1